MRSRRRYSPEFPGAVQIPSMIEEVYRRRHGWQSWNYPPHNATAGFSPTAGTAYFATLPLAAGQPVSDIRWLTWTAGAGTAPTHFYTYLCDKNGVVLSVSADLAASTYLTTAGPGSYAITSYTPPVTDIYVACFLQIGSWGTTQWQVGRANGNSGSGKPIGSFPAMWGTAGTSLSAAPVVNDTLTLTSSTIAFQVGCGL